MKISVALNALLIVAVTSPALAAPPKYRAPARQVMASPVGPAVNAYAAYGYARPSDIVVFGNRIIGEDPDANIRTQFLYDPAVSDN
jgi:hypothetical protein